MVGTRRSRSTAIADPIPDDAEVPKELRRLHINGKDTMRGEARKAGDESVYFWRGAAYAITADTPEEWITAEAHKHRNKSDDTRKPRKRSFEEELMDTGDMAEDERPSKKRKSTSALFPEKTTTRSGRDVKRTRKSLPNPPPYPHQHQQRQQHLPKPLHSESAHRRPATPPTPIHSKDDRRVTQGIIDDKKSEAREDGLEVDPLPGGAPLISSSSVEPPQNPSFGLQVFRDVEKLAHVNSRIVRLQEQYGKMKASPAFIALRRKREARMAAEQLATPEDGTAMDETVNRHRELSYDESLLRAQLTAAIEDAPDYTTIADSEDSSPDPLGRSESEAYEYEHAEEATLPEPSNTLASPAATPEVESDSSHFDRHDSATASSVCAHSSTTVISATSVESDLLTTKSTPPSTVGSRKASRRLPTKNRGGNKLRWSIDNTTASIKPPEMRLSEHRKSEDRAEGGIFKGRMEGESKQSRRRRIRREKQVLQTMGEVELDD